MVRYICPQPVSGYALYKRLLSGKKMDIQQIRHSVYNKHHSLADRAMDILWVAGNFGDLSLVMWYYTEIIFKLCEHGNVPPEDLQRRHPIFYNSSLEKLADICKHFYYMPLFLCRRGHLSIFRFYLSIKYKKDFLSSDTFIYAACENGHLKMAKFLYKNGYTVYSRYDDVYPIIAAARNGHLKVVKWLCRIGCRPTVDCSNAIYLATYNGHLDIVKFLYSQGCDPTTNDNHAIKIASAHGDLDIVKFLYSVGCDPTAGDNYVFHMGKSNVVDYFYSIGFPKPPPWKNEILTRFFPETNGV